MSEANGYDAFISYSHRDKEWVRGWLLLRLEQAGLRVCIDFRDFEPGVPIVKEVERAVLRSRKMLLVLTPSYLDSEWAELESILSATLDPAAQRRRVIPLLLKPCEIPLRIRTLIYLDFTQPSEAEFQLCRMVVTMGLGEGNRRLWQLKELHHRLQGAAMDIGVFQSFVQLLQQTNPPPRIEDLRNLWERQCLPRLISLGELLEREVAGDVRKVIDDVAQWQRNLQEALDDERSAILVRVAHHCTALVLSHLLT